MSVQTDIYDFIKAAVDAAAAGDVLYDAEVHDTPFRQINTEKGVSVWYTKAAIAPLPGSNGVNRSDVVLMLMCYFAAGRDKADQAAGRDHAEQFANAVAMLFFNDPRMGGRCEYSRPFAARDGFDELKGTDYAVVHLAIVVNETGLLSQAELERRAFG